MIKDYRFICHIVIGPHKNVRAEVDFQIEKLGAVVEVLDEKAVAKADDFYHDIVKVFHGRTKEIILLRASFLGLGWLRVPFYPGRNE